jgi:hypothetical protein
MEGIATEGWLCWLTEGSALGGKGSGAQKGILADRPRWRNGRSGGISSALYKAPNDPPQDLSEI